MPVTPTNTSSLMPSYVSAQRAFFLAQSYSTSPPCQRRFRSSFLSLRTPRTSPRMRTPALRPVVAIRWNSCDPEMRLLHTSDWHIGVNHYRLDRTPDLDHVFAQIKEIARDDRV